MAEEAKKKPDAAPAAPAAAGHGDKAADKKDAKSAGGGLMTKTPVLLGAAMIIEAVVLFAGFKFLGSAPKPATGAELTTEDGSAGESAPAEGHGAPAAEHGASSGGGHGGAADSKADAPKIKPKQIIEIPLVDFKAQNRLSGKTILYDVAIVAATKGMYKDKVTATFKEREALIKDRIRTIIAQCEPEKLAEPGLETLRRQVKYQLDEIFGGEAIIDEVLVPRCIPFRTDY